ncbi:energy-coupling factor ABC transporter ATP-binding protein [Paenibacillus sp. GCM10027627]|uniref:energy-coupling factor ABC transporter ATP-binding protein n=1 Tax=unclassified Paenibacillus TaxID=185978 RepID=UPI003627499E
MILEEQLELIVQELVVAIPSVTGLGETTLIKPTSFTVQKGEWISLIGANGSGKSTLLKAIAGMPVNGAQGRVHYTGRKSTDGAVVPIVMQQPEGGIIGATPWEDVVAMLEKNSEEGGTIAAQAEEALRAVGLGDRMHQPVETLSGGQKQLVAIAACLAVNSSLLLLDEITSMLDPLMSIEVLEQARSLHASGTAVIWVTQNMDELRPQDRLFVIDDGCLSFDDTAEKLFRRGDGQSASLSAAEQFGFTAPYSVQVAWELEKSGIKLSQLPFTPEELAEAVTRHGR